MKQHPGRGGRAKEAQSEFLVIMEDTIRQPDYAQSVQRYQLAVDHAKVRLNLAMAPMAWLMPANMIMNKASVVSYNNTLDEKKRHDEALEAYEAAQARYVQECTKLLDWIETNREIKAQAKQTIMNTNYTLKLYNQAHPDGHMTLPKEPKLSDFYQPSEAQKQGELLFVGGGVIALAYAAFHFL